MLEEKIRQIERPGFGIGERGERLRAREELVAVRAGETLDVLLLQNGVEPSTGAAIGVGDEDRAIAVAIRADLGLHGCRNALRAVVKLRGKAAHIKRWSTDSPAATRRSHARALRSR